MKIRHKQSGVELEGMFCQFGVPTDYGVSHHYRLVGTGYYSQYDCREWEEVKPAPKWVDVTGECHVNKYENIIVRGVLGIASMLDEKDGCRFRKVKLLQASASCAALSAPQYEAVDAFIIEQRQP